jgi:chaperonin GroES
MLIPLDDRIVIRKKVSATMTDGGVFLPETLEQEAMEGEVVAVGPGKYDKDGERIPPVVAVGDFVIFGEWSAKDMLVDGEMLSVMREDDIIGILHKNGE